MRIAAFSLVLLFAGLFYFNNFVLKKRDLIETDKDRQKDLAIYVASKAASGDAGLAEIDKVKKELQDLKEQQAKQINADERTKALTQADAFYIKWKDAEVLAGVTARVNLPAQVAILQGLRAEYALIVVPQCLDLGKSKLIEAMNLKIDGFLTFIADSNLGKYVYEANNTKALALIKDYEDIRASCIQLPN